VEIPINTVIAIDQVLRVPLQTPAGELVLDVPVKTDFPINLVVPVDFNETIPIDTVVQLNATIPIEIDVAQTPLAGYLQQIKMDLARLRGRLSLQRVNVEGEGLVVTDPQSARIDGSSEPGPADQPAAELTVEVFVAPETVEATSTSSPEAVSEEPAETPTSVSTPAAAEPTGDETDQAALLAYAVSVGTVGEQLSQAVEKFGASALRFRSGQLALDAFRGEFSQFAPKVRGLVEEVDQLSPPLEAEPVHQGLKKGLEKCDQAVDLMEGWFDTPAEGTDDTVTRLVTECVQEVSKTQQELVELIR
jgi:hypothetical protein